MILLSGHSLTEAGKIPVESMSLNLSERDSSASMTPADMSGITINSWMKDETNPGAGIVWRVRSIQNKYDTDTPVIQLEHVINTLRDKILFGEITPATITGNPDATTCTAQQAVNYILAQQSDWTLYSFDYGSVSAAYKFDGDTLYDALEMVSKTLNDAWWSFDMSVYPFRLSIKQKASGVVCEMRPGRNLRTLSKTVDRTGMYTRFYPIGKDDLHITGNYVERNVSTYGLVCKVEVDSSLTTEAELTAWANERLSKHAQPTVNIVADGLELADATGETLDRLKLGRICRIPLPEFGTIIEERIVELRYNDKTRLPEQVQITLANKREDLTRILADEIKNGGGPNGSGRGGGGGRGGVRQAKEDHAWFEDTDEHVAMVAEGIVGVDANGKPNWTRLSSFIVDGQGIHGNSHTLVDGILTNQSTLDITENRVSVVVTNEANPKVKPAVIVAGINGQTGSYVKISATTIDLSGYVTVSSLNAVDAKIDNLTSGNSTAAHLKAVLGNITSLTVGSTFKALGHNVYWQSGTIDGTSYHFLGYVG